MRNTIIFYSILILGIVMISLYIFIINSVILHAYATLESSTASITTRPLRDDRANAYAGLIMLVAFTVGATIYQLYHRKYSIPSKPSSLQRPTGISELTVYPSSEDKDLESSCYISNPVFPVPHFSNASPERTSRAGHSTLEVT